MDNTATVKRVSLDFKWEIGRVWEGFINPWPGAMICMACEGSGFNDPTKKLFDTFETWSRKLSKVEQAIFLDGYSEKELKMLLAGKLLPHHANYFDIRQDMTEVRANRKNVLGYCEPCQGNGDVSNDNPAVIQLYRGVNLFEEWTPIQPPTGSGWQLWTEGEMGSPASPVFQSAEELAKWCAKEIRPSEAEWLQWILNQPNPQEMEADEDQQLVLPSEWLRVFVKPPTKSD
jgi:hypothetical protein